jgi:hypothetical protein
MSSSGSGTAPLSLVSTIEELFERKSSGFGLESLEYGRRDIVCCGLKLHKLKEHALNLKICQSNYSVREVKNRPNVRKVH